MLFTIQFVNPYKNKKGLNIYPLRLIFKLLSDDRIEKKLSNDEVSHILYYIKQVKGDSEYDNIIREIIKFRKLCDSEKIKKIKASSAQFVINYVSCNYLFNFLSNMGITNQKKQKDTQVYKQPKCFCNAFFK